MTDIGSKQYPELEFSKALEIIAMIRDKNIKTVPSIASELGYSPKSRGGNLYYRLSALNKHYGLIDQDKDDISLTSIGKRIMHPLSEADKTEACKESVGRVLLLRELFEKLGANYHDSDFKPKLKELTGADPVEIEKKAPTVERIYGDAIPFLRDSQLPPSPKNAMDAFDFFVPPSAPLDAGKEKVGAPPQSATEYRTFQGGTNYAVRVKVEERILDEVISLLEALKKSARKEP